MHSGTISDEISMITQKIPGIQNEYRGNNLVREAGLELVIIPTMEILQLQNAVVSLDFPHITHFDGIHRKSPKGKK